jgi:hypothetical protein
MRLAFMPFSIHREAQAWRRACIPYLAAPPYLLAELESSPNHWFVALRKITGANPIKKAILEIC